MSHTAELFRKARRAGADRLDAWLVEEISGYVSARLMSMRTRSIRAVILAAVFRHGVFTGSSAP
jgi:hypothetical protein